jgi:hypothetical protein
VKVKAPTTLLAAIAFAVLLFPGAAIARARPASRQTPPQVSEQFTLSATNGYEVGVSVTNRRRLILSAHKFTDVLEAASYSLRVQPRHGSDHVVARLGRLGRIDVRFVPGKVHREKPPRGCHGPATVIEQGHFVGVIMFHGARGFTEAHARRAVGAVTRTPPLSCPRVAPPPNPKKLLHKIEALEHEQKAEEAESEEEAGTESLAVKLSATAREGHVNLMAFKSAIREGHAKGFALTTIAVFGHRQRGRIKEEGAAAILFAKGSTFLVPNRKKPTSEGVLQPPLPFSGSATFRRHQAKAPTWTGDLNIDLPGFGQVRLAGPGTSASMCEGTACLLRGFPSGQSLLRRLAGPPVP